MTTPNTIAGQEAEQLTKTIDKIAEGFADFREKQDEGMRALRADVDRLETRASRAALGDGTAAPAEARETYTLNGRPVQVLRGAEELRSHYSQRAASDGSGTMEIRAADFMRAVAGLAASPEARAVLNTGTDADGGYMVPTRLMGEVMAALVPESALLQAGAGTLALDAQDFGAKSLTLAATDTVPTAAWRSENGNVSESSPGFRAVAVVPRSLAFYFKVSREWLADAVGTDPALTTAIAQAFAKEMDRAGLRGTGTAPEPRGVLNTSGIIAVANGANGASLATTKYTNFFTGAQQMLEANGPMPTAAIMSPRSRVTLGALLDSTGQPVQVPPMLSGLRWLHTSQIPNNLTVGTSTDCSELYFGDFSKVVFAMRERMSIQRLSEAFATSGQVGFVCHARVDVAVLYPKAVGVVTGVRA